MTKKQIHWETLASLARDEPIPSLDVAPWVTQTIAGAYTLPISNWPTWPAAGVSVAAALLAMLTAAVSGVSWNDPMGDWLSTLFLVMS